MKYYFTIIAYISILFFSACTKKDEFLEKPATIEFEVNTSSATKTFEVWLNDELIEDSVSLNLLLRKNISAGKHHLRIRQSAMNDYFVDTLINMPWSSKQYQFSLIELEPNLDPLFFSGFPEDIPAPEEGFVTYAFLNIDPTPITKGKTIDILLYDMNDPSNLLYEFNNLPYSKISKYFKIPLEVNNNGGLLVIRDSQNKQLLLDGRESWLTLYPPYYIPGHSKNTAIMKINNDDAQYPWYYIAPIFEADR